MKSFFKTKEKPIKTGNTRARYRIMYVLLGIFLLMLGFRAYELVFNSPVPGSIQSPPPPIRRGIIFDSDGHELAVSRDRISVAARPSEIVNPQQTAYLLAGSLNLSEKKILQKIQQDQSFIYIDRKIPIDDVQQIRQLKLPGIIFEKNPNRYYPNKTLASTVIGFVGIDNQGLAGIEFQYNDALTRDTDATFTGNNVHLSLNAIIQHQLEKFLKRKYLESKSKAAVGIISEVRSGRLLAMTSLPDFDPNNFAASPASHHRNRALSDAYEPGSTFKVFTIAALMQNRLLDEEKKYNCPGYFEYRGHRLDFSYNHGLLSFSDVIKKSCNEAIIEAAWKLPVLRFHENLKQFGFGTLSKIGLPAESRGFLPAPKNWDIWRKMTIPIGHGISVTPLQLVVAGNAVANGGYIMQPTIVDRIVSTEGEEIKKSEPTIKHQVLSRQTSEKVRLYLEEVVAAGGTGRLANPNLPDITVCGKTGTSVKAGPDGYGEGKNRKYQATFLGFFPCKAPEVSIVIWFDEPKGVAHQGGNLAAPVFRDVVKEILPLVHKGKLMDVESLSELQYDNKTYTPLVMPDLRGKSKKEIMRIIYRYFPGDHTLTGKGYLLKQSPEPGSRIARPYSFELKFGFISRNSE